jgi:hypothetical protein
VVFRDWNQNSRVDPVPKGTEYLLVKNFTAIQPAEDKYIE